MTPSMPTATRWPPNYGRCTAADPDVKRVVDVAMGLEGLRRQDGIHAAAVVISNDPLTEHLPVQRKPEPGGRPEDAPIVTQYEMHAVEELGLLKMDFLGLRNLSVIERTLDMVELNTGYPAQHRRPAPRRPGHVRPVAAGVTRSACSSWKAPTCGHWCGRWPPRTWGTSPPCVALYRPGPMAANMHNDYADRKNGRKPITYLHPDMAEVLSDTYGLMIYQESMLRVAQRFAGYTLVEAETLRKAAGKKVREIMAKEREKFVAGCEKTGYGTAIGTALFDIIEPFADYAFGKSHAFGYGMVAYWTAWLKANHPVEYMACLLTSVKDDKDKMAVYLAECRSMGIEVLVPDINLSASDFTAVRADRRRGARPEAAPAGPGKTRPFGLSAIRNVGEGLVERIVAEREAMARSRTSTTSATGSTPSCSTSARSSRWSRRAPSMPGPPTPGPVPGVRAGRGRTLARRREADQGVLSLFGDPGGGEPDLRRLPGARPGPGVRQAHQARLRKRDARPVRERPPPGGGGGRPCAGTPTARSSTCAKSASRAATARPPARQRRPAGVARSGTAGWRAWSPGSPASTPSGAS